MKNELLTEDQVKKELGIDDFRHINKKQLIEFVSSIPNMEKEVAIKCIEEFPRFKDYSTTIIERYYELCDTAIKNSHKSEIEAYRLILDELRDMLKKPYIRKSERQYIIEKMVEIGDRIGNAEDKRLELMHDILQKAGAIAAICVTAAAAALGVKINKK